MEYKTDLCSLPWHIPGHQFGRVKSADLYLRTRTSYIPTFPALARIIDASVRYGVLSDFSITDKAFLVVIFEYNMDFKYINTIFNV